MNKGELIAFIVLAVLVAGSILAVLWTEPERPFPGGCQVIRGKLPDDFVPPSASLNPDAHRAEDKP